MAIQQGSRLSGSKRGTYVIGSFIASGGEGDVYSVDGHPDEVAKIYNDKKMVPTQYVSDMRTHLEKKLRIMVDHPVDHNNKFGKLCIAWPIDVLYDAGKMVGYIMPRVTTKKKIYDVCRESTRLKMFPDYTWKYSVALAINLAWTVDHVHSHGYCIGDFNPNNILVDDRANITLIDTDSFDVTDPNTGTLYKCMVGVPEMLAPELQGRGDLRNPRVRFTKESDQFSLAIHIFNLLMNNCHPFNCTNIASARSSSSDSPLTTDIAEGHFYYGTVVPSNIKLPHTAPDYDMLPPYIKDLFERTFRYTAQTAISSTTKRATAKEWHEALKRLVSESYTICRIDKHHEYLSDYGQKKGCPWCAVDSVVNSANKQMQQRTVYSGNTINTYNAATNNTYSYSSGQSTTTQTHVPQTRRSATPLYIACIIMGLAGGLFLAPYFCQIFDISDASELNTIRTIAAIVGLIEGPILAHFFEKKYMDAYNGWPWLMISLLMPVAVALTALAIVAGIAAIGLIIAIAGAALMIGITAACCGGS